jgi:alpha-L-fucosidase
MTLLKKIIFYSFVLCTQGVVAQATYYPTSSNLYARDHFQDDKYGLFVHWGASSTLGAGEWVMNNRSINAEDYKRLMQFFNPQAFDAAKWVSLAKASGMKYITFITRHHDGFSNWDTKASDFNIMNTPYKKDVLKQLADECKKQGIKLHLYYSLLDWSRSDYQYETGRTGKGSGRTQKSDWNSYVAFMKAQLTELLTNYGDVGAIWFDGHWDQLDDDHNKNAVSHVDWRYNELYTLIHKLQPACLIGNNHHLTPLAGEDFQTFEKDLPGGNSTGFGGASVSKLPLETCETLNDSWGFNITDHNYKTVKQVIQYIVKAAGHGSNFLLNVGPMPNGEIQPEFNSRLLEVGSWLNQYGETIYGTRGGFLSPQTWGCITEKKNKAYIHLLDQKESKLLFQCPYKVLSATVFIDKKSIKLTALDDNYYVLDLKEVVRNDYDTVIELDIVR